jgi:hypothetical protein
MNWTAILFFVAAALALTAFLIGLSKGHARLSLAAAAVAMAAFGVAQLRKSRSQQPGSES